VGLKMGDLVLGEEIAIRVVSDSRIYWSAYDDEKVRLGPEVIELKAELESWDPLASAGWEDSPCPDCLERQVVELICPVEDDSEGRWFATLTFETEWGADIWYLLISRSTYAEHAEKLWKVGKDYTLRVWSDPWPGTYLGDKQNQWVGAQAPNNSPQAKGEEDDKDEETLQAGRGPGLDSGPGG